MSSVAVIGAGIGGLATAVRAASEGREVTVFEAAPEVGGKLRELHLEGYRFDLGPSLFTWPDLLLDTLQKAGQHAAPFEYTKLDRSCHYFWSQSEGEGNYCRCGPLDGQRCLGPVVPADQRGRAATRRSPWVNATRDRG